MANFLLALLLFVGCLSVFASPVSARTDGWNSKKGTLWDVSASADGKWTAVAAAAGFVQVLNQQTLQPVIQFHMSKKPVFTVAFSADSRYMATCSSRGQVRIFNTSDWQTEHQFEVGKICGLLAFGKQQLAVVGSPDSKEKYRSLWLYDLPSETLSPPIMKDNTNIKYISAMRFAPDGTTLAVGSSNAKQEVDLWRCAKGKAQKLRTIKARGDISALAFSSDGDFLAGGGTAGQLSLWQTQTGKRFWQKPWRKEKKFISSVDFSPKGDVIAVCGMGSGAPVTFYRKGNGAPAGELGKERSMNCNQVRFDASGKHIYVVRQVFSNFNEQVLTRYRR